MWPTWFGLLGGLSSMVSILFYFENYPLLLIQQAKSVNQYSVTQTTTVHVVIGMDGHVITVTYSCLVILDMGVGTLNVSSCVILIDYTRCVSGCRKAFKTFERI